MAKKSQFGKKNKVVERLRAIFSEMIYRGIPLWPSMAPRTYIFADKKSMGSFFFQIIQMIKFLFFAERFNVSGKSNRILCSFLINREDHHKLWEKCLSMFKLNELTLIDAYQGNKKNFNKKRFRFYLPSLFKILSIEKELFKLGLRKNIQNRLDYFHFVLMTYYMYKKIDYWVAIYDSYIPKAYISYSSYRNNDETIMTQICKKNGKITFTLQNYAILGFQNFNYESITYENMVSDYFLLWGNAGKRILEKYMSKDKLLVVGNPFYLPIKRKKREPFNATVATVSLDYPQYDKSNFELIKIIKEFTNKNNKIKFFFSLHPDLNRKKYMDIIKGENIELWDDREGKNAWMKKVDGSDFLIIHNTTIALESLKFQIPILRYKDKTSARMMIPELIFSNVKELKSLLAKLKRGLNHGSDYYTAYYENFYQPKKFDISGYYKKKIIEKIDGSNIDKSL